MLLKISYSLVSLFILLSSFLKFCWFNFPFFYHFWCFWIEPLNFIHDFVHFLLVCMKMCFYGPVWEYGENVTVEGLNSKGKPENKFGLEYFSFSFTLLLRNNYFILFFLKWVLVRLNIFLCWDVFFFVDEIFDSLFFYLFSEDLLIMELLKIRVWVQIS